MNGGFKMRQKRGRITITEHAKQRLRERAPQIKKNDYTSFVNAARYRGYTRDYLRSHYPEIEKYVYRRYGLNNSTEIRVYKGYVFIFCGNSHKARTLRTVVNLPADMFVLIENMDGRDYA